MTNEDSIKEIVDDVCMGCELLERCERERCCYYNAIKALEDSSHIIDALEELKNDTLDELVSFGVEKSIDCIKNMRRKQHDKS